MIVGLIPACGQSRRMGRPKLTLPIEGQPLLERVIRAFRDGGVDHVLVIAAPSSEPGAADLLQIGRAAGAEVLVADHPTPDMRSTVELGLERLSRGTPPDLVVLSPADAPGLSSQAVARLLEESARQPARILVPVVLGKRGHPLLLPWPIARQIPELPKNVGVNALLRQHDSQIHEVALTDPGLLEDLDTPEDYQRWHA